MTLVRAPASRISKVCISFARIKKNGKEKGEKKGVAEGKEKKNDFFNFPQK